MCKLADPGWKSQTRRASKWSSRTGCTVRQIWGLRVNPLFSNTLSFNRWPWEKGNSSVGPRISPGEVKLGQMPSVSLAQASDGWGPPNVGCTGFSGLCVRKE